MTMIKAYFKPNPDTEYEYTVAEISQGLEQIDLLLNDIQVVPTFKETGEEWGIPGRIDGISIEHHISKIAEIVCYMKNCMGWDFIIAL